MQVARAAQKQLGPGAGQIAATGQPGSKSSAQQASCAGTATGTAAVVAGVDGRADADVEIFEGGVLAAGATFAFGGPLNTASKATNTQVRLQTACRLHACMVDLHMGSLLHA